MQTLCEEAMNIEQMQHGVKMALGLQDLGATVTFSKAEFTAMLRAAEIGLQAAQGAIGLAGDLAYKVANSAEIARYIVEGK